MSALPLLILLGMGVLAVLVKIGVNGRDIAGGLMLLLIVTLIVGVIRQALGVTLLTAFGIFAGTLALGGAWAWMRAKR